MNANEALEQVRALAEEWRYKGEFGWDDGSHAYGPDQEGQVLDGASAQLRAILDAVTPDAPVTGEGERAFLWGLIADTINEVYADDADDTDARVLASNITPRVLAHFRLTPATTRSGAES